MENVVGGGSQSAGVGENKVGSNEKIREVVGGEVAGDGLVVVSGASVFEDGLVIAGINPDLFERSRAKGGVGRAEVGEVMVGLRGSLHACEIKGCDGVASPADCDDCASSEGRGR